MITTTKRYSELNFEDEENMLNSIKIVRAEYLKKAIKASGCIGIILICAISYLIFSYLPNLNNEATVYLTNNIAISFDLTIGWILLSSSVFWIMYLIRLISIKFTPSLVNYIKQETTHIGFEFSKRIESVFLFYILNVISILLLLYLDSGIIQFPNNESGQLLKFLFLLYLIMNLFVPVIWAFSNDGFVIKINENFIILCNLRYKLRKKKNQPSCFLGILLTSNKLCSKFDKSGNSIYSYISQRRWLKQKKTSIISPYLQFQEFSIPVNFQKQFLNIVMALNDWENNYSNNLDTLNYYFSRYFPFNKYKITKYSECFTEDQFLNYMFFRF